jgi:hypothetical protein
MNANRALLDAAKVQFITITNMMDSLQIKKATILQKQLENKRRLPAPNYEYDKEVDEQLGKQLQEAQAQYNEVLENHSRASFFLAAAMGILRIEKDNGSEEYLIETADRIKERLFPMLVNLNNLPSFDNAEAGDDEFFSDILNMGNIYMTAFKTSMAVGSLFIATEWKGTPRKTPDESMDKLDHKSQQQQYSLKHLPMNRNPTLDRTSYAKMTVVKLDPEKK